MRVLVFIFLGVTFSSYSSASDTTFEKLYMQSAQNLYLASNASHSKNTLKKFGHSVCGKKKFCLIWFFDDKNKAKEGIKAMKSGNTWDPISGLIGIYSKNKKVNDLICYEKSGNC